MDFKAIYEVLVCFCKALEVKIEQALLKHQHKTGFFDAEEWGWKYTEKFNSVKIHKVE